MNEKRYISEPIVLEQRANSEGVNEDFISGYGIVFNKWSSVLRMKTTKGDIINFIEKINPLALDGLDTSNMVSMVDHTHTLGKRAKGTLDITTDGYGVKYYVKVPNTTVGKDAKENIRNGNLEGSSFQFAIPNGGDSWDKTVTPHERTINKFSSVSEMGPVTYPAYPDTTAAMRSLETTEIEAPYEPNYKAIEMKSKILKLNKKNEQ